MNQNPLFEACEAMSEKVTKSEKRPRFWIQFEQFGFFFDGLDF